MLVLLSLVLSYLIIQTKVDQPFPCKLSGNCTKTHSTFETKFVLFFIPGFPWKQKVILFCVVRISVSANMFSIVHWRLGWSLLILGWPSQRWYALVHTHWSTHTHHTHTHTHTHHTHTHTHTHTSTHTIRTHTHTIRTHTHTIRTHTHTYKPT